MMANTNTTIHLNLPFENHLCWSDITIQRGAQEYFVRCRFLWRNRGWNHTKCDWIRNRRTREVLVKAHHTAVYVWKHFTRACKSTEVLAALLFETSACCQHVRDDRVLTGVADVLLPMTSGVKDASIFCGHCYTDHRWTLDSGFCNLRTQLSAAALSASDGTNITLTACAWTSIGAS